MTSICMSLSSHFQPTGLHNPFGSVLLASWCKSSQRHTTDATGNGAVSGASHVGGGESDDASSGGDSAGSMDNVCPRTLMNGVES